MAYVVMGLLSCRASLNTSGVVYRSLCSRWGTHRLLVASAALANDRLRRLAVRRKMPAAGAADTPRPYANGTPTRTSDLRGRNFSGQFLLLCSLQLWQQLQRCRQTRSRVPFFYILLPAETVSPQMTCFLGKRTV